MRCVATRPARCMPLLDGSYLVDSRIYYRATTDVYIMRFAPNFSRAAFFVAL